MFLFVQSWDIVRGQEAEYTDFVLREYLSEMQRMGLNVLGGFHVVAGAGPNISAVTASNDLTSLARALESDNFPRMTARFQKFIVNYSSRLLKHTGRVTEVPYSIEPGTWRLNQHFTLVPDAEKSYSDFLEKECVPALIERGIRIKAEWQGLVGSGPSRILLEGVAKNIEDIASALVSDAFSRVKSTLMAMYARHYSSRILAPTGRVEAAFILREMTKAL
jgi:hypothetical protein